MKPDDVAPVDAPMMALPAEWLEPGAVVPVTPVTVRVLIDFINGMSAYNRRVTEEIERLQSPAPAAWVSVDERLPDAGKPVLIVDGKTVARACYFTALFWECTDGDIDDADLDYNEGKDAYFYKPGWYEWNTHEETHWQIDAPKLWQPLPPITPPAVTEETSNENE